MKVLFPSAIAFLLFSCVQPQPTEQSDGGGNQRPVITSLDALPSTIPVGKTCDVKCIAYDPLGNELSYTWRVDLGDIVGSGSEVKYVAAYCCAGVNRIIVTVTNSHSASTSQSVDVQVTQ